MSAEIVRPQSPSAAQGIMNQYRPDELNADLAAATLVRELVAKLPIPAIDTRKFTIIHGLMEAMNHKEPTDEDPVGNLTYLDTTRIIKLMDRVSEKSVNSDGKYFNNIFAYLMKPKYIIQGMPQTGVQEEAKPGILQRVLGWGKKGNGQQEAANK